MIKVNIYDLFGSQFWRSILFNWYPIDQNKKRFFQNGISFNYFSSEKSSLFECDVLFIASSHFMWTKTTYAKKMAFLERARKSVPRIIWFDHEDSSGNTQFEVLPFVDRYLKKQLLRDRSLYSKELFLHNVASNFIHNRFAPKDSYWINTPAYIPLPINAYSKVGVSWNLGAYPIRCGAHSSLQYWTSVFMDYLERTFSYNHYILSQNPESNQTINLLGLFGIKYPSETIAFQRNLALQILKEYKRDNLLVGSHKLHPNKYWQCLYKSKIVLSLWGWGEVCVREMEGFIAGAAIIMPDMSHLETWPQLYSPMETYYPISWDLSDLIEACDDLLSNNNKRIHIAKMGQKRFLQTFSEQCKEAFVQRIIQEISGTAAVTT
jgi:hypothetical protein